VIPNVLLALSSAAMLVLLFPPFGFVWLAPFALAPLLIACAREDRWLPRFALGYAAGIVYWCGLCHWIQWTMEHHGGMTGGLAWFCFALFCLAKAVQMGAFAALSGILLRKWYAAPAIAAVWVIVEWTHPYTGFEWLNLGNAASDMPLPLRLAPVTGVWGISFAFALMGAVVAVMVMRLQKHPVLWLLPLPCLLLLSDLPAARKGTAGAVVVQPNIDDDAVWTQDLLDGTEQQMRLLSLSAAGRDGATDVIVWPEVPAPYYEADPAFTGLLSSIAKQAHAAVLAGVVARTTPRSPPLNSALLLNANGTRVSRYDKVNLVPFGEFVPWPFGVITQKISAEAGDFTPGGGIVVSKLRDHSIGTFICYESVFPGYIRRFAAAGAQVLFNISNDSWFGKTAARYQHLLIVRMRAAENDRWIVRATNNGITAVIDPAGRVGATLPEYREASARVMYNYTTRQTFYTQHGDWFVLLCALGSMTAIVTASLPSRYTPRSE
jgi:apolipoprotein N-acyltransferase